jgi:DNA-binding NtrC family response regulator
MNSEVQSISNSAMELLKQHKWPGNIRELENCIERAFVVETTSQIQVESLPDSLRKLSGPVFQQAPSGNPSSAPHGPLDYEIFKENAEREFIVNALKANRGKINQTVAQANIPKNTLLRKIRKYSINPEDYKI